jgi:hypothetical protein
MKDHQVTTDPYRRRTINRTDTMRSTLLLLLCAASLTASAQSGPLSDAPRAGDTVRITLTSQRHRITGQLLTLTRDSMSARVTDDSMVALGRGTIRHIDFATGHHRNALVGMKIGALVGAAILAFAGYGQGDDDHCQPQERCSWGSRRSDKAIGGAWVGAWFGAGMGLFVGHGISTTTWERVTPYTPLVASAAPGAAVRLGTTIAASGFPAR